MHRVIRDHLEQVLAAPESIHPVNASRTTSASRTEWSGHLAACVECRQEIAAMREQAATLRGIRAEVEPRPGFYARVMERIEAQRPVSIWNAFSESAFGRRVAVASMAVALLLGAYLVVSEPAQNPSVLSSRPIQLLIGSQQSGMAFANPGLPDRDAVLVNLVTYREQ